MNSPEAKKNVSKIKKNKKQIINSGISNKKSIKSAHTKIEGFEDRKGGSNNIDIKMNK